MKTLHGLLAGSLVVLTALHGAATGAQEFPNKPIKIVAPTGPGISPDIISRVVAEELTKTLGQPVIVENRPGASGMIGADLVASSPADGYTILLGWSGLMSMNPHLYGTQRFDPKSKFVPIIHALNTPFVLIATKTAPYNTLAELGDYAKQKPGQVMYSSTGVGSHSHVATELIASKLGVKMVHVPYSTSSPVTDVVSGVVQMHLDPMVTAAPMVNADRVKALAVSSDERADSLPKVPTLGETWPGFSSYSMVGFYVPKGTPEPIIEILSSKIDDVLKNPDARKRFIEMGYEVVGSTPDEFAQRWDEDYTIWGKVIKDASIKLE